MRADLSITRRRWMSACVAAFLMAGQPASASSGDITTYAGNGLGDGGLASIAALRSPTGVAVDSAGNVFFADSGNDRIRKVDTSGTITTVAGKGPERGYSGDGGPATSAHLSHPTGVAVDAAGNLFIADRTNNRIRKVDTSGVITTVAGNGTFGYGGDGGPATSASLSHPFGVAVNSTGLFIADGRNHRIRRVDPSGLITTVVGTGTHGYSGDGGPALGARLFHPQGVAVDAAGNLFIAESSNQRIRKVDVSGVITTVAGNGTFGYSGDGGPATSANLGAPVGVAVDSTGSLFIADFYNSTVRKVDASGTITTVAGTGGWLYAGDGGPAVLASLRYVAGVAVDSAGNLFVADHLSNRIRRVDLSGTIDTYAGGGVGDGGPATGANLKDPTAVAVDTAGNLFIADTINHRVRKVDTSGTIATVAGNGTQGFPDSCCYSDGGYSGDGGPATSASLDHPTGVAVDSAGNLFIADSFNDRIRKVDTSGIITTVAGGGSWSSTGDGGPATAASLSHPTGVAVDAVGNLFIAEPGRGRIRKVDMFGIITTVAGNGTWGYAGDGGLATSAKLAYPMGVAVDSTGSLFIADSHNHVIRKVTLGLLITTVAGNGVQGYSGDGGSATKSKLNLPRGVAVDSNGNLFIADTSNHRIRKVTPLEGIVTTVAGNGTFGYSGDGGPATNASLNHPFGIAVDSKGNLFVADMRNGRIRKVAA